MWGSYIEGELHFGSVAEWSSCSVGSFSMGQLRCGVAAMWGSCGMGESQHGGVAARESCSGGVVVVWES